MTTDGLGGLDMTVIGHLPPAPFHAGLASCQATSPAHAITARASQVPVVCRSDYLDTASPRLSGLPVIIILLFIWSPATSAQDLSLTLPTIAFVASAASDQASTVYGFHTPPLVRGASTLTFVEADPLYAWTDRHSGSYVAVSTTVDLLTALFARRLGRQHPRLAAVGLYTLSALRLTAAAQNLHRVASLR